MKKVYKLTVEPITAVHIGTGDQVTPLDYIVTSTIGKTDFKRNIYLKYSWNKILDSLNNNKNALLEFSSISDRNNMSALRDFFHKYVSLSSFDAICETTNDFASAFKTNIAKDPVVNAMAVAEMVRDINHCAIIPGSSLKGAVRTAILNEYYQKSKPHFEKISDEIVQKKLLGYEDPKGDPLKCIGLSDCSCEFSKGTQIVSRVVNVKVTNGELKKKPSAQVFAEFLRGELIGQKTVAEGTLTVDEDKQNLGKLKRISKEDIINACNNFYLTEFNNEVNKFYGYETENTRIIDDLCNKIDEIVSQKDTFIIRCGHWSQIEFVTLHDIRRPKTSKKKYGTTRFVMDYDGQYVPIGWCGCKLEEIKTE